MINQIKAFKSLAGYEANQNDITPNDLVMVDAEIVIEQRFDGENWIRIYSNGFMEQGGFAVGTSRFTINFQVPFKNTPIVATVRRTDAKNAGTDASGITKVNSINTVNTTSLNIGTYGTSGNYWYVAGW